MGSRWQVDRCPGAHVLGIVVLSPYASNRPTHQMCIGETGFSTRMPPGVQKQQQNIPEEFISQSSRGRTQLERH